ncbi:phosphate transporter [Rhizoclosmatium globosum]|uniref:Phosphate transporter n=1 Tax=Rhizoclosmatium globosum TaxID=329046 RepID=A0A1Y2BSW1_9FUNG|nr:phosphate transporter [Rhizoclosmatium globosum]|eukprot:ORY37215.1 phosphate transporter [Rhizoclosmatium globosum]
MAPLPLPVNSYTWIFGLTVAFAFLDAYAIGANDVANSFATSVGSRSLKLWQACCIAIFTEFLGAILLGASTTGTIKDGIISLGQFDKRQDLLMAGFMCALIGSSSWVMLATRFGWPVSTTHSIVGAIIGVGISAFGTGAVNWGWENKGVGQIVASWLISPAVAGILAMIIYGLTRQFVLKAKNPLRAGIYAIPVYFTITTFIVTFYVASKNGKSTLKITAAYFGAPVVFTGDVTLCMIIVASVSGFVLLFTTIFAIPYFIRRLEKEEDLKWYHIFYIFAVPTQPKNENLERQLALQFTPHLVEDGHKEEPVVVHTEKVSAIKAAGDTTDSIGIFDTVKNGFRGTYELAKKGLFLDVAGIQSANAKDAHAHATLYDNKVEFLFSFLQVMTASFASFGHGSNDVANAIGPLAAVYDLWSTGQVAKNANVQTWMLAMGGFAIDCGLALYGWRIMINLGNNLTYHSPSRGFSMELGAALSVITASFLALPVSTTQCIVGATIGVGLMNGNLKSVNWKMVSWTLFSWILTLPIAGVSAGCLFAFVTRGPSFNQAPVAPK